MSTQPTALRVENAVAPIALWTARPRLSWVLPAGTGVHYAFGCVDDVLYRRIAGLQAAEPGFRRSVLAPDLDGPLDHVAAGIATPYGALRIDWSRPDPDAATIAVTVPPNTTSTVVLPDGWKSSDPVTELGRGDHTVSASRR